MSLEMQWIANYLETFRRLPPLAQLCEKWQLTTAEAKAVLREWRMMNKPKGQMSLL